MELTPNLHAFLWTSPSANNCNTYLNASMNVDLSRFTPDFFLTEGELKVGDIPLNVYHTPGHSPVRSLPSDFPQPPLA